MANKAQEIIIPKEPGIFRTVFLYVGQGESTLMVIPDGENYKYMLIDCNIDKKKYEIDLVKLFNDLLDGKLDFFVNTHPHKDHLEGITELHESKSFEEIWHSGHEPKGKHKDYFEEFKKILDEYNEENKFQMLGSNEVNKLDGDEHRIGDVDYQILSPAEYVCDDIDGEDDETHYRRIHEHCAVIKFTYGTNPKSILITGDADIDAWKKHITDYHKDDLNAIVLSASHHGSRTFFKKSKNDDPYVDHINEIKPEYIIVSAPKQEDSEHEHPHDDAIKLYKEKISDDDNLIHLGENYECVIVDINKEGDIQVYTDKDLIEQYGFPDNDGDDGDKKNKFKSIGLSGTRIDDKPMGI